MIEGAKETLLWERVVRYADDGVHKRTYTEWKMMSGPGGRWFRFVEHDEEGAWTRGVYLTIQDAAYAVLNVLWTRWVRRAQAWVWQQAGDGPWINRTDRSEHLRRRAKALSDGSPDGEIKALDRLLCDEEEGLLEIRAAVGESTVDRFHAHWYYQIEMSVRGDPAARPFVLLPVAEQEARIKAMRQFWDAANRGQLSGLAPEYGRL